MKPSMHHTARNRKYLQCGVVCVLWAAFASVRIFALGENLDLYNAPQALAMGNAFSTIATGHAALFYNPAGLARGHRKELEIAPIALDFLLGSGGAGTIIDGQTFGMSKLLQKVPQKTDRYSYFRGTLIPAFAQRNFAVAMLASYHFAARSDDGTNVDTDAGTDVGLVTGGAFAMAGNLIKVGVSLKAIARNQLKGVYDPTTFTDQNAVASAMKSGLGIGGDIGMLFTLPQKYLPTLSFTWNDVLDTRFLPSTILNSRAQGKPDPIRQSLHTGFSIQPNFNKRVRSILTAELRHIERNDWPMRKKIHIGLQLETDRAFYFWLGLNQLYFTGGIALRVPGGDIEMGTYGVDVGAGNVVEQDRRFFMRYTIGF